MHTKADILNRNDLERMLGLFYAKVFEDELLGYIFTDVAHMDLKAHLPVITDFWESIVLNGTAYKGNPMKVHGDLHLKHKLEKKHFDRWLEIFHESVDDLFAGPMAEQIKTRAASIATVMLIKLNQVS